MSLGTEVAVPTSEEPTSARKAASRRLAALLRDPLTAVATLVLLIVVCAAVFAPWIAPYDPSEQSAERLAAFSGQHLLGTDDLGRDTLSRIIFGARASLGVSVSVVLLAMIVAVPLGLLAGYKRSWLDYILMRVAEVGLSVPPLILAVTVASILGPGTVNTTISLTIVFIPGLMRVVRVRALEVGAETYIEASRAIGTRDWWIITRRVLPSTWSPVLVQGTVMLGAALLAEAALSFLGFGVRLPTPSWGNILRAAYDQALFINPWQVAIPGIVIALTILSSNRLGDSLREILGLGAGVVKTRGGRRGLTTVERPAAPAPVENPPEDALAIRGITVQFGTGENRTTVLQDLNLTVRKGQVLGLVGESGSGKSVTALSVMRLLPSPPALITSGRIWLNGTDVLSLSAKRMREVRGAGVGMIFQDPMTSLDPAFTVASHLREALVNHKNMSRAQVEARSLELLDLVHIPDARRRLKAYPHELSGGMRQRIMIAVALACEPSLLIADEPTTALDVTVQAQVMNLLRELQRELGMSMLLVTHDLGVIADICDEVAVMYAGQIVEQAGVEEIFDRPAHPYTEGLLKSMPRLDQRRERLDVIPGVVPSPQNMPAGCRFHTRCEYATAACATEAVELQVVPAQERRVRCLRAGELTLLGSLEAAGAGGER